jgi:hypothetical protein
MVLILGLLRAQAYAESAKDAPAGPGQRGYSTGPCDHLPDPPGQAVGIDLRCRPSGSSSGVAKADFNNDGFGDLAIGAPYEDVGSVSNAGKVWVIYGSASGLTASGVSGVRPAAQTFSQGAGGVPGTAAAADFFGASLAAGDFNNDGITDLAIGAPGDDGATGTDSGSVTIIYGSSDGLVTSSPTIPAPTVLEPSRALDCGALLCKSDGTFGTALTWGDFDGDGANDLAIGQPGTGSVDSGLVWVIYGAAGTPMTNNARRGTVHPSAPLEDDSREGGQRFGIVLSAGRFNSDGIYDLVVGAPYDDVGSAVDAGSVYVFLGCADVIANCSGRFIINQNVSGVAGTAETGDYFGWSIASGDFDNDLRDDLAVGVPFEDAGVLTNYGIVQVFFGSASGVTQRNAQLWDQNAIFGSQVDPLFGSVDESRDEFGYTLAAADFNGDGYKDLAIGVPFEDVLTNRTGTLTTVTDAGEVDVLYGSSAGLSTTGRSPQSWHQDTVNVEDIAETSDRFGFTLSAWNWGGPGNVADLAIGVIGQDVNGQRDCGAVAVLYGSPTANGLSASGDQLWHQEVAGVPNTCEANDQFGRALY